MIKARFNQKGFAVLESLLILVIIAVIGGIGWYAYNSKSKTDKILSQADKISQSTPARTNKTQSNTSSAQQTKHLDIVQWGIMIPYSGDDTYSYTYSADSPAIIELVSENLSRNYDCTDFGAGILGRAKPSDIVSTDTTAQQAAEQNPTHFKLVSGYYYTISHDQAACSDSVTADAQNQVNNVTMSLVPGIEAIPQ